MNEEVKNSIAIHPKVLTLDFVPDIVKRKKKIRWGHLTLVVKYVYLVIKQVKNMKISAKCADKALTLPFGYFRSFS